MHTRQSASLALHLPNSNRSKNSHRPFRGMGKKMPRERTRQRIDAALPNVSTYDHPCPGLHIVSNRYQSFSVARRQACVRSWVCFLKSFALGVVVCLKFRREIIVPSRLPTVLCTNPIKFIFPPRSKWLCAFFACTCACT